MAHTITGIRRFLSNIYIRMIVLIHVSSLAVKGKVSLRHYLTVLQRLEYFLRKMQENKFVSIDGKTRIALYVPGAPSRAFSTACDKFTVFNDKLPCTTVLVSITSACAFRCPHCYQKHDRGSDVQRDFLTKALRAMQQAGIAFFNIEGGEPFMVFDRLMTVCESIDNRSEIWINSTGHGMSRKNLGELKERGVTAIMFPLHHYEKTVMNRFMGSDKAWDTIHKGIALCHEANIPVALNMCPERDHFYNGTFEKCMDKALDLNVAIIQIIKPKPSGGWLDGGASLFTDDDLKQVRHKVHQYNHDRRYRHYPAISAQVVEEDVSLFGCPAGGTDRFYLNAKGDVQPCEFLNISFGNISREDFTSIYHRMRETFRVPCSSWLCEKYSGSIAEMFHRHQLDTLPLSEELSRRLYTRWNRGSETPLYKTLEGR